MIVSTALSLHVSFVVDKGPTFARQAALLARSLLDAGKLEPGAITAFLVNGTDIEVDRSLRNLGIGTAWVEPFGHPWCNKLQQLRELEGVDADRFLLLDTDMLAIRPVSLPQSSAILGKMVDFAVPPLDLLATLVAEAGVPLTTVESDVDVAPTVAGNLNGGLVVIPRDRLGTLAEAWPRWARWSLARIERFGRWHPHVDQVALALSIAECRLPVEALGREHNTPTHLGPMAQEEPPRMLHYHRAVDHEGLLRPTGDPTVDSAIRMANQAIRGWHAAEPGLRPDAWHASDRGPGDPVESSPVPAAEHAPGWAPGSTLERAMRIVRPKSRTTVSDAGPGPCADLAVCLDVLPTIDDPVLYRATVARAINRGRMASVLSGLDDLPPVPDTSIHLHEPLIRTIEADPDTVAIPIAVNESRVTYLVIRGDASRANPRDASPETLRRAVARSDVDATVLLDCVTTSRRELGFFPDHLPRALEYPWALATIRAYGRGSMRVADVGAGVSVLPLMVADAGHLVLTIDSHPVTRTPADRATLTEWGYLDYSTLRPSIRSVRAPYEDHVPDGPLDAIVSISVIEHLPAELRRRWLSRMADQLVPGGLLVLTLDLVPMSRDVWRYREGEEVETKPEHGTLDDVLAELRGCGFATDQVSVAPWMPGCRVGLARIAARRILEPVAKLAAWGVRGSPSSTAVTERAEAKLPAASALVPRNPRARRGGTVTVLVPAFRSGHRLTGLLASIAAQTYGDVIVRVSVDYAPGHPLPVVPPMGHVRLEVVDQSVRLGWVGNVNWLLSSVTSPWFLLIPHDDQLTPTYLTDAIAALLDHPKASAAHGALRFHGIRDGQLHVTASIQGDRTERIRTFLDRGPHVAGLNQRGVVRSSLLRQGMRFRTRRSDGQFTNDLMAFEAVIGGETLFLEGVFYDKFTDPDGLSRVLIGRSADEKSAMFADNLACLIEMLTERGFDPDEQEQIATRWAEWLLGLQGTWNVLADEPSSDAAPLRSVRPAIARFIARSLVSATTPGKGHVGREVIRDVTATVSADLVRMSEAGHRPSR